MSFSVTLDSVQSVIAPSEGGMSWKEAIDSVLEYCRDSGYALQEEFFEVVSESKKDYLSGNMSISLT